MKKIIYLKVIVLSALLFSASCKKGDIGPDGQQGPAGEEGPQGEKGDKGSTGSANVLYSNWVSATNARDTVIDNAKLKIADIAAPSLKSAMLNNATIQVFIDYGAGVFILPYTAYAGFKVSTISFIPRTGRLIITRFTDDNSGSVSLSLQLRYRYIIIPGGREVAIKANIDFNNYEAVKKYYNIRD